MRAAGGGVGRQLSRGVRVSWADESRTGDRARPDCGPVTGQARRLQVRASVTVSSVARRSPGRIGAAMTVTVSHGFICPFVVIDPVPI